MSVKKIKSTPILKSRFDLHENQIRSKSDFIVLHRSRPNLIVPQPIKKFPSQSFSTDKLEEYLTKEFFEIIAPINQTECFKSSYYNYYYLDFGMEIENKKIEKNNILRKKKETNLHNLKQQENENWIEEEEIEEDYLNNCSSSNWENSEKSSINKKPILPFSPPLRSKCPFRNNNQFF
ncbi:hypothetical protein M0813_26094 [Anaeramoeba flamelloides]|uniref:Uncharacterized protein n=1 Tax=Anaeramoeba flamelloides TaxID=1746091 RepID=A0ABQ8Y3K4_9EUKA|nr:hypothetical protein M0813_26094 [Anaeramoeba flamelloides]